MITRLLTVVLLALCFSRHATSIAASGNVSSIDIASLSNYTSSKSVLSPATTTGNNSLSLPTFLPHRFRVPGTETVLRLGFGIIRKRLDPQELQSLLRLSIAVVQEGVVQHGGEAYYPHGPGMIQSYAQAGFGLELRIQEIREAPEAFTWQQLREALDGLLMYMVDKKHSYEVLFTFCNGPGRFPDLYEPTLGIGQVRELENANYTVQR